MKLRFRANSLRVRVNQIEVRKLAAGESLREKIDFPGGSALSYILKTVSAADPQAFFAHNSIQIAAPLALVSGWAESEEIGLYFTLATGIEPLKIAIEKDLECIDGPVHEKDPDAYPRSFSEKTC
jgi:hypothetical protein